MAVPKVAVIALVAIIAVPILLGYGMNLSQVTVTDYEVSNDTVNVTPLLRTSSQVDTYAYTHGDSYTLNSKFGLSADSFNVYPVFESIQNNYTASPVIQSHYTGTFNLGLTAVQFGDIYAAFDALYDVSTDGIRLTIYDENHTMVRQQNYVKTMYYDAPTLRINYT